MNRRIHHPSTGRSAALHCLPSDTHANAGQSISRSYPGRYPSAAQRRPNDEAYQKRERYPNHRRSNKNPHILSAAPLKKRPENAEWATKSVNLNLLVYDNPSVSDIPAGDREARARRRKNLLQRQAILKRKRQILYIKLAIYGCLLLPGLLCAVLWLLPLFSDRDLSESPDNQLQEPAAIRQLNLFQPDQIQGINTAIYNRHPMWEENFLTVNEYSRPGDSIGKVKNIFIHYTANPRTSAAQNRSYFEQLKDTGETSASAHFIIGNQGEIIQCIPLDEMAYAVQTRNQDSISIECCHMTQDGSFTQETYDSLVRLLAWLTEAYGLDEEDILRHYDSGGKKCPLYFTENEDAWIQLKADVSAASANSNAQTVTVQP